MPCLVVHGPPSQLIQLCPLDAPCTPNFACAALSNGVLTWNADAAALRLARA